MTPVNPPNPSDIPTPSGGSKPPFPTGSPGAGTSGGLMSQPMPGWAGYIQWLRSMQPQPKPIFAPQQAFVPQQMPFTVNQPSPQIPMGGWTNPHYFNPFTRPTPPISPPQIQGY